MEEQILKKEDIDFSKVRDLIVYIIAEVGGEHGLSLTGIHKTSFGIKKKLKEDNEVKRSLPFYWYYYGPYSEVVMEAIQIALKKQKQKSENW